MNLYSPAGYLVVSLLLLGLAASPLLRAADSSWHANSSRTGTIDGLRGFLALGVFFHHTLIYNRFLTNGVWEVPPSVLYTQLGQSGVILFFMVTGYLFWNKAIEARGSLNWVSLYTGRVFRIGPVYFLATFMMLAIVFWKTGFALHEPLTTIWRQIAPLVLFGYFTPGPEINSYASPGLILAGVTWTLHFEWIFYLLLLPVSAIFARKPSWHLIYTVCGFVLLLLLIARQPSVPSVGFGAFYAGMLAASLRAQNLVVSSTPTAQRLTSGIVILLLGLLLLTPTAYSVTPLILLSAIFGLVSLGCSVFGLLTMKASRRLGEISYGIYLLQGVVLYIFFNNPELQKFALTSNLFYWLVILLAALTLVCIAMLTHVLVEKPGIDLGRKLARRISPLNIPSKQETNQQQGKI